MPCLSPNSGEIKRKCRQAEQKNEKDSLLVSNEILKKTNILLVKNGTKKKKKPRPSFIATKCHKTRGLPKTTDTTIFPPPRQQSEASPMISELNFCKWNQTDQVTADPSLHFKPSALLNHIKGLSLCNYEDTIAKLLLSSGPSDIMPVWFRKERAPSVLR